MQLNSSFLLCYLRLFVSKPKPQLHFPNKTRAHSKALILSIILYMEKNCLLDNSQIVVTLENEKAWPFSGENHWRKKKKGKWFKQLHLVIFPDSVFLGNLIRHIWFISYSLLYYLIFIFLIANLKDYSSRRKSIKEEICV